MGTGAEDIPSVGLRDGPTGNKGETIELRKTCRTTSKDPGGEDRRVALTTNTEPDSETHNPRETRRAERLMSQERTY